MAPNKAAILFKNKTPDAFSYRVTLFGSLAATGKGHLTDKTIIEELSPKPVEIIWKPDVFLSIHPNGMTFEALKSDGAVMESWTTYSIGGGDLYSETQSETNHVYPHNNMTEILKYALKNGISLWEYVEEYEGSEIWDFLKERWEEMKNCVEEGLKKEGVLPGELHLARRAASFFLKSNYVIGTLNRKATVFAYALAVSEENASGGIVVTAPTCGSAGVLPGVLYHTWKDYNTPEERIYKAMATAALIGNVVKHNASVSGADVGCQGEVGTACAMAAGAATQIFGGSNFQIEYAAEMGLEHHLGLTCDPVCGLVQIPCIERNAFAAERALDAAAYATLSDGRHFLTFDEVVEAMKNTGHDLPSLYKETSKGGLAFVVDESDLL